MAVRRVVWQGLDAPRMEVAHVELQGRDLRARGTQIGAGYELHYELEPGGVPSLGVARSAQRYELMHPDRVRFSSGSFVAELDLDADGFVLRYEGLAERVS